VADEVERRTTTFAALGHDLRTPLAGLRLKTELVEDPKLRAELLVSIRKMESIADASLAFLRGESLDEPKRLVDLNALVESEVVEFEENGEPVTMEPGPALRCRCRPDSIARAVRNLVENALKYGGRADVRVVDAGPWAEIQVRDQGPGIPPDPGLDLTRPFVRHPAARSADPGSFGLGLAVVKAVADAHDGQFELRPNDPVGLIAALRIPVAEA
jgi:signal transduction histidine kinase